MKNNKKLQEIAINGPNKFCCQETSKYCLWFLLWYYLWHLESACILLNQKNSIGVRNANTREYLYGMFVILNASIKHGFFSEDNMCSFQNSLPIPFVIFYIQLFLRGR